MFTRNEPKLPNRLIAFILGQFILALAVSISVKSNLGISPVNSIPYVISLISGIEQGLVTTAVFCIFILLQVVILRKDFRKMDLCQVFCASLFGYFVTVTNRLLSSIPSPESYLVRIAFLLTSILLIAIGILTYLSAELISQPAEGLCLAISSKWGWEYHKVKVAFDCTLVTIAATLALVFEGKFVGVREGTLVTMVGVGWTIGVIKKLMKK